MIWSAALLFKWLYMSVSSPRKAGSTAGCHMVAGAPRIALANASPPASPMAFVSMCSEFSPRFTLSASANAIAPLSLIRLK